MAGPFYCFSKCHVIIFLLYFTLKLCLFQLRKEGIKGEEKKGGLTCKTNSNTGFKIKHLFRDDIGVPKALLLPSRVLLAIILQ